MINPEIINERLREMRENLDLLEELKSIPFDKFCNEPKTFKLARYCLQISIQCILDICHHIIVSNDWTKPATNKEAIEIISRNNVIPEEFAKRILPLAGLRNILIHEYIKIDPQKIYECLQYIAEFREFQRYIITYLKNIH